MNSTNNLHPYAAQSYSQTLLVNVSRIVFGVFAMTGNGFILYVIGKSPSIRRNLCNLLIGVLAFADFLTGAGLFFGSCTTLGFQLFQWYNYTTGHCLILQYVAISSIQMSQIATVFIAFDRLKAVQDPILYHVQDRIKRFSLALSVTIIYSLIATAFIFVGINFNDYPTICQAGSILNQKYVYYWELFAVVVAAVVILCYVRTSRMMSKKLQAAKTDRFESELAKQKAVFKTVSIVLIVYGLCWCLPNFINIVATVLGASPILLGKLTPFIATGTGIHSSANVVVYAWKHKEFGSAMKKVFSNGAGTTTKTINTVQSVELTNRKATISGVTIKVYSRT